MEGFERERSDMKVPSENVPDVGVNPGEIPNEDHAPDVPFPALDDMLKKIRNNPDWVPPKPVDDEGDRKDPTIN